MTADADKPKPPEVNGPAFLVFGLLFIALGLSRGQNLFVILGLLAVVVGAWGIVAMRRWERETGTQDILPGAPRPRPEDEFEPTPRSAEEDPAE